MYLRFTLIKLIEGIMALLGLFMYPLAYVFNYLIGWNILIFHPWQNFDEDSTLSNWHGDANWRNAQGFERAGALKKFWIAYKWGALRNPSWNFKNWIGASARGEKIYLNKKGLTKPLYNYFFLRGPLLRPPSPLRPRFVAVFTNRFVA